MVTLEEVERLIEETWTSEVRDEVKKTYMGLAEKLDNSAAFKDIVRGREGTDLFFELESNLSHNFYYQLKKKLISENFFPEIFIDVQGLYPTERYKELEKKDEFKKPDMMILQNDKPLIAIELKCQNSASTKGTPNQKEVEKDIIKLSKFHYQNKLGRAYMFLFSRESWNAPRRTENIYASNTYKEWKEIRKNVLSILEDAEYLKIGYGFYEIDKWDKWGFWDYRYFDDYPNFLKNPK